MCCLYKKLILNFVGVKIMDGSERIMTAKCYFGGNEGGADKLKTTGVCHKITCSI